MNRSKESPPRVLRRLWQSLGLALAVLALLATSTPTAGSAQTEEERSPLARWFQVNVNSVTAANLDSHKTLIARADSLGYNGILLRGGRVGYDRYLDDLADTADANGLDVIVSLGSLGRCQNMLGSLNADDNLVAGHRTRTKMQLQPNGRLLPHPDLEAVLESPTDSFTLIGDSRGTSDETVVRYGGLGTDTQYRATISFEDPQSLPPGMTLAIAVFGSENDERVRDIGTMFHRNKLVGPGLNPAIVTFNTRSYENIIIDLELGNVENGSQVKVSGISVEAVPTLNMLDRSDLFGSNDYSAEVEIRQRRRLIDTENNADSSAFYLIDPDRPAIVVTGDPKLGERTSPFGTFSISHEPPEILVPSDSPLWANNKKRDYYLTVYHALVHRTGTLASVACDWTNEGIVGTGDVDSRTLGVFGDLAKEVASSRGEIIDGVLLNLDEIRDAGYEGAERDDLSGALNTAVKELTTDVKAAFGQLQHEVDVYAWADMFDTTANAVRCFNVVAGSLEQPTPMPDGVTLVNWDESKNQSFDHVCPGVVPKTRDVPVNDACPSADDVDPADPRSSDFTTERTGSLDAVHRVAPGQIIGAYYEAGSSNRLSVAQDHCAWATAWDQADRPTIGGVVYTTWYEKFGDYPTGPVPKCTGSDQELTAVNCPHQNMSDFAEQWWGHAQIVKTDNGGAADTFWGLFTDADGIDRRMWLGREGDTSHPVTACRAELIDMLGDPTVQTVTWPDLADRQTTDHNEAELPTCSGLTSLRDFTG